MFNGKRWDKETGLYYSRARYYDPAAGRFTSADPLGYYDSMNLYEYCWNNPLNWVDPWGLCGGGGGGEKPQTLEDLYRIWEMDDSIESYSIWDDPVFQACLVTAGLWKAFYTGIQAGGWLNSNRYLRIGYGRKGGNKVFRAAGSIVRKFFKKNHLDFWTGGKL